MVIQYKNKSLGHMIKTLVCVFVMMGVDGFRPV